MANKCIERSAMTTNTNQIETLPEEISSAMTTNTNQIETLPEENSSARRRNGVDPTARNFCHLLVLFIGGTFGMRQKNGVYEPEPNYLFNELRKLPMLHDQQYFSNHLSDDYNENATLVLPSPTTNGRRVLYDIVEYEPLLDSSNMAHDDYTQLATDIEKNYTKFDAFVILHGTDTMAYTASALSFMLENLDKSVILTGSQIPVFEPRSDGIRNFSSALIIAADYNIPEVAIFFDNVLLRGNRTTKVDNESFHAFDSPNVQPLANVGTSIRVNWEVVNHRPQLEQQQQQQFSVNTEMCRNVGVLRLYPDITAKTIRDFLQPQIQGVVLQTYGRGNGPTACEEIMAALQEACNRGVLIVNTTQCLRGHVSPIYAVGKELQDIGIFAGWDMTVEAALMKLSYTLARGDWSMKTKQKMIGVNLRGEMSE